MPPEWLNEISLRLKGLIRRGELDRDLEDELSFHMAMREQKLAEQGVKPEEAHSAARRGFGNATLLKETTRELWGFRLLETLGQDLHYGLRQLRCNPGFTVVAVLTLALGIGANTAIFSVVNAVLLRTLPVKHPGELALLFNGPNTGTSSGDPTIGRWTEVSYDAYQYFLRNNQSWQDLAAFREGRDRMEVSWPDGRSHGHAEHAVGQLVSGNYFKVVGVSAALGRALEPSDDEANARPVALVSYDYWTQKLNRDPDAVGRAVDLNGTPFTVVGIAPPEFFGERMYEHPPDFWIPLTFQSGITRRQSYLTRKDEYWLNLVGRLKPGVKRAQAQAILDVQLREFIEGQAGAKPSEHDRRAIKEAYVQLVPGGTGISYLRYFYSEPLHVLMAIVALLLLVACANVANLLLSRSAVRRREMSMRLVVGATRPRLVRQMLTESVLLATFGAAAGLLLANWGVHVLSSLLSRELVLDVTTNPAVLAFTLAVSLLTGFAFGLAPALRMSRTELGQALKGGTSAGAMSRSRLIQGLVVFQVAVSLALLACAGLMAHSLVNLEDQNLGFNRDNVLLVGTDPRLAGIKVGDLDALYQQLLARLNTLPGVRSATIAYYSPMSGSRSTVGLSVQGYTPHPGENMVTNLNQVAPNYFETLGIPVLRGRPVGPQDTATSPRVAVVNQAFAERFYHGQNPVGRHIWINQNTSSPPTDIIGLVADARYENPGEAPQPFAYVPLSQVPDFFAGNIEIRTKGDAAGAAAEVRQAVKEVDSALPITSVQTLRKQVNDKLNQPQLVARLSVLFGLLGLILAAVGLYGVISYSTARRTQEIGIRMAMGAQKTDVLKMVVGDGARLALMGVAIGVPAALGVTRLVSSLLYGVKASDPLTFIGVALILIAVALLACYIPARRATKVDPMVALRYE